MHPPSRKRSSFDSGSAASDLTRVEIVERGIARCLERRSQGQSTDLDAACSDDPELAHEVREALDLLDSMGLSAKGDEGPPSLLQRKADFAIRECLGGGSMGVVYRAEQLSTGRDVALKLVRPELLSVGRAHERFEREVRAVSRLRHPDIVAIRDHGGAPVPYLAMELVRGATLAGVLHDLQGRAPEELDGESFRRVVCARSGVEPEDPPSASLFEGSWEVVCVNVVRRVALALEHAHSSGVLHRDVKPSNVMVTPEGRVVLTDFGLAQVRGSNRVTRSGDIVGSEAYMAPELHRGEGRGDARSDVYSLGVTLYELFTLRLPFDASSALATRQSAALGPIDSPRGLNTALSRSACDVCAIAMDPSPARRYATAGALARDLTRVLARRPPSARRPGPAVRAWRAVRRRPALAVLVAALLLLLAGALAFAAEQARLRGAVVRSERAKEQTLELVQGVLEAALVQLPAGSRRPLQDRLLGRIGELESVASDSSEAAMLRQNIAPVLLDVGLPAQALEFVESSMVYHERHLGRRSQAFATDLFLLGRAQCDLGRHRLARDTMLEAVELLATADGTPRITDAQAQLELGRVLLADRNRIAAMNAANEALAGFRTTGDSRRQLECLVLLARARVRFGDVAGAAESLDQAHSLAAGFMTRDDPMAIELRRIAVGEALVLGHLDDAERESRSLIEDVLATTGETHPELPGDLYQLAWILRLRGRYDEAVETNRRARRLRAELSPRHIDHVRDVLFLSICALDRGDPEEAIEHALAALRLAREFDVKVELESEVWFRLSLALGAVGDIEGALLAVDDAIALRAASGRARRAMSLAWAQRGLLLRAQGDDEAAREAFARGDSVLQELAAQGEERFGPIRLMHFAEVRAQLFMLWGRSAEAEALLRDCLELQLQLRPESVHWWTGHVARLLAQAVSAQGRFDEADRLLELASNGVAELGPEQPRRRLVLHALADAHERAGCPELAAEGRVSAGWRPLELSIW